MKKSHPILICTVGTSLFQPNLNALKDRLSEGRVEDKYRALAEAYQEKHWLTVAEELAKLPPADRLCGAEINSIDSMIQKGYAEVACGLYFLHSNTDEGAQVAEVLQHYYRQKKHKPVEAVPVPDLQDADPKLFRTRGLRNLAQKVAEVVRKHSPAACAINATGGYKAQIALAVVLGQAFGVTVYYKHERFSEVIAFPPLPVALDFELWLQASGMLEELASSQEIVPAARYDDAWDDRYESLVLREAIGSEEYLELSPTGQIFHETFRERFRSARDLILPPEAPAKEPPRLENAGWPGKHPEIKAFLQRVTDEVPFVKHCFTKYFNPDLPETTRFLLRQGEVQGVYSDGKYCLKFGVQTTAQTEGQRAAAVAALNAWLRDGDYFRS